MIQNQIKADLKQAMLQKNEDVKNILRVVIGEFNREGKEVSDEKAIAIIKKMAQNAKDQENIDEQVILEGYLPTQMDELELKRVLMNHIMNMDETPTIRDMGKVMGWLKSTHAGTYDGKLASTIVKQLLS